MTPPTSVEIWLSCYRQCLDIRGLDEESEQLCPCAGEREAVWFIGLPLVRSWQCMLLKSLGVGREWRRRDGLF